MASSPRPECNSAIAEVGSLIASIRQEVAMLHAGGQADKGLLGEIHLLLAEIEAELAPIGGQHA